LQPGKRDGGRRHCTTCFDGRVETGGYEVVNDDDGLLNGAEETVSARSGSLSSPVDELYVSNVEASRIWNDRLRGGSS